MPGVEAVEQLLQAALASSIGDAAAKRIISTIALAAAGATAEAVAAEQLQQKATVAARAAPYVSQLLSALSTPPAAAATAAATAAGGPAELAALRAYLGAPLATPLAGSNLSFLREAVSRLEGPANPGGSFLALLGRPLVRLGRLSSRQVRTLLALPASATHWGLGWVGLAGSWGGMGGGVVGGVWFGVLISGAVRCSGAAFSRGVG